mmetsp:Transcript_79563/g.221377  ORF Transcript_79563/g.221377 Transcript_79563/m.221377 type:complete len:253 (+) Transcript_79563:71-829(+)
MESLQAMEFGASPPGYEHMKALPEQHEDQMLHGFRMIQQAYNNRVTHMEQELRGLKMNYDEHKQQASTLHRRNSTLEGELVESHHRAEKLAEENKTLFDTVQTLRKQLLKLEGLKKKVLDSISSEGTSHASDDEDKRNIVAGSAALPSTAPFGSHLAEPLARQPSPATARPAAPSPFSTTDGNAAVDGKQFFRQARSALSYEAFNEFLANIKKLNSQQQTREETLLEARRIFGTELQPLYQEFELLLSRHAV